VAGYEDGSVRLWSADGAGVAAGFHAHSGPVVAVAFDPEGKRILSVGKDRSARVWYLDGKPAGEPIRGGSDSAYHFCPAANCILSFRAHPQRTPARFWREEWLPGQHVFHGVYPGSQFGFATIDGTAFSNPFGEPEPSINGLAFDLAEGRILARSRDGLLRYWVRYGNEPRFHPSGDPFGNTTSRTFAMAPTSDGRLVATGGLGNGIEVWARDRLVAGPLRGHDRGISRLSFGPGNGFLVSGGGDATVRVWDLRDSLTRTVGAHIMEVYFVSFSRDGSRLVSAGGKASVGDPGVIVWTLQGQRVADFYRGPNFAAAAAIVGKSIAIAGGEGSLWLDQGNNQVKTLASRNRPRSSILIADADGNLVRAGSDGSLDVWNPSGASIVARPPPRRGPPSAVWLSPDGLSLVTAAADGTVSVQDRKGAALIASFNIPRKVASIALSPDGTQIVAGGADGTVSMWNRNGRESRNPIQAHNGATTSIAVSPAGDLVVTAGSDGTLRLWDSAGNPIGGPAAVHTAKVTSVTFSPDGTMVASAGQDGAVRVTSVNWRMWLRLACERLKFHPALFDSGDPVAGAARLTCETVRSSKL
jgi:WD40 repeat protein